MNNITKKNLKINKNLYYNLIPRHDRPLPEIVLDVNEWFSLFAILELFRKNKYKVDAGGCIPFDFKEYNRLFLAGRKGRSSSEAAETIEALKGRKFNLVFRDKKSEPEILEEKRLFDYSGGIKEAKKIRLQKVFYHNILSGYFNLPGGFMERLVRSMSDLGGGRIIPADIIIPIYAACYNRQYHLKVSKSISELAAGLGLDGALKARQNNRIIGAMCHALDVSINLGLLKDYELDKKKENITMFFARLPEAKARAK